jgi:phage tail-like protein
MDFDNLKDEVTNGFESGQKKQPDMKNKPEPPRKPLTGRGDPDVAFSFYVEIDNIRCVKVREIRGLEWKAETVSFYQGGNHAYKVNLIGPGSFTPLVLKRGFFSTSSEFFDWMKRTMSGSKEKVERKSLAVVIQNEAGEEIARYNVFGAFISRYVGPNLVGTESQIGFEEIEIVYDYFDFVPGKQEGALQSGLAGSLKGQI